MAYVPAVQVPSPVQFDIANFAYPAATSGSSTSLTVASGHLVLVIVGVNGGGPVTVGTVTDGLGNTYSRVKQLNGGNNGGCLELWAAENVTGGSIVVSVSLSGSTSQLAWALQVIDMANTPTSSVFDVVGSGSVVNTSFAYADSVTPTADGDLMMFFMSEERGGGAATTTYNIIAAPPPGLYQEVTGSTAPTDGAVTCLYAPTPTISVTNKIQFSNATAVSGYALAVAINGLSPSAPVSGVTLQDAQSSGVTTGGSGAASVSMANIASGDVLLLYFSVVAASTTMTVTDSQGNTWTLLKSIARPTLTGKFVVYGLLATASTSSTLTVTATAASGKPVMINCLRFSGSTGLPTQFGSGDDVYNGSTTTWSVKTTGETIPNPPTGGLVITGVALVSNGTAEGGPGATTGPLTTKSAQVSGFTFVAGSSHNTGLNPPQVLGTFLTPAYTTSVPVSAGGTIGVDSGNGTSPDMEMTQLSVILASTALSVTATGTPSSGTSPLSVSFTATASGGTTPYTYAWTFGDGGTSTAQNPSHTYTSGGNFTAKVTVTDAVSDTASTTVTTQVTGPAPSTGGSSGGTYTQLVTQPCVAGSGAPLTPAPTTPKQETQPAGTDLELVPGSFYDRCDQVYKSPSGVILPLGPHT